MSDQVVTRDSSKDLEIDDKEREELEKQNEKEREEALAFLTGEGDEDTDDDKILNNSEVGDDDQDDTDDDSDDDNDDADDDQEDGEDEDDDSDSDDDDDADEDDDSADSDLDEDDDSDDSDSEDEAEKIKASEKDDKNFAKNLDKETKKRFNRALRQRSEYRERAAQLEEELEAEKAYGNYGRTIATFAKNNQMSDADLSNWLERGAEIQKLPQTAEAVGAHLVKWATDLGYQLPQSEPVKPDLAPVQQKLKAMIENFDYMSEDSARELMSLISEATAKAAPEQKAPAPAPAAAPAAPTPAQPTQSINTSAFAKQDIDAGTAALSDKMKAAKERLGKKVYDQIWPKVNKRLQRYAGTHPSTWAEIFDDALQLEERKLSRRKEPKKKPHKTVRSNSHSDTTKDRENDMSPREAAIADLTGESPRV